MRALIFDPVAGVAGDMTLAALLDLGLPAEWLRDFVAGLDLGDIGVHIERVQRCGIASTYVRFELPPEKGHRHLRHLLEIVARAPAPERARERAADAFRRIAAAEAAVHGTSIEKVHFHEVGALDSIIDIVGSVFAFDYFGFDDVVSSPLNVRRLMGR